MYYIHVFALRALRLPGVLVVGDIAPNADPATPLKEYIDDSRCSWLDTNDQSQLYDRPSPEAQIANNSSHWPLNLQSTLYSLRAGEVVNESVRPRYHE